MKYYVYGFTDKGNFRNHNEDAMLINHEVIRCGGAEAVISAPFLSAVCDGVGGEHKGEIASKLCLQYLSLLNYNSSTDLSFELMTIHNNIKKYGITHDDSVNMQTTLCCLAVDESGGAICVNVGDSRLYRYVKGKARQISSDQTYGKYLYEQGEINDLDELDPQMRSAIISSVGSVLQNPKIDLFPFVTTFGLEYDDTVFIFSDGVSDFISTDEIEIAMSLELPFKDKIEALCELALKSGSTDNISVIGIKPFNSSEEYDNIIAPKIVRKEEFVPQVAIEEKDLADKSIACLEKFINDLDNADN